MENNLIKVAVYIRVSTDKQAKTGDSLRDQETILYEYIDEHDNMIKHDTYIDEGISGQKLDRDEFKRLIDDIKSRKIDLIIFTKLDRWFRSLRHYLNTQEILEKYNVSWTAINQPYFDTSTPHGRAFVNQSMMWAELEAQNDSVRILDVFDTKVKYGEVLSGNAPLGYSIVDKHLVPNEDADIVRDIFNFYKNNGSLYATMYYMKDTYNKFMTVTNLKKSVLLNKKYIGVFRTNNSYCEPIIDKETFDYVQRMLPNNIKASSKNVYILSGLMICDECGGKMCGVMQTQKRKSGKRYDYKAYRCSKKWNGNRCINKKHPYEITTERFLLENIKIELKKYITDYELTSRPTINNTSKKNTILKKIDKLKDLYINDLITLEEFKIDKEKYTMQLESIPTIVEEKKDLGNLKELLELDIESIYSELDESEKRNFWRSIIKEIRVDSNRKYTIVFL